MYYSVTLNHFIATPPGNNIAITPTQDSFTSNLSFLVRNIEYDPRFDFKNNDYFKRLKLFYQNYVYKHPNDLIDYFLNNRINSLEKIMLGI